MAIVTNLEQLINRRTKILATVGPASQEPPALQALMEAGVNVFRLNMSHGTQQEHRVVFETIRRLSSEVAMPVGILVDLCGPKIRTGDFETGGIELVAGTEVTVTTRETIGKTGLIVSQYRELAADVKPDDRILLADGVFELSVVSVKGEDIVCRVIHGGRLTNHKGINLPGVDVSAPSLTAKDIDDARFALELGADYLALSFVRTAEDIRALRRLVDESGRQTMIVAKIEKPEALTNADEILETTDAIMVARGDLGVELPPEKVPIAQSQLIDMAKLRGKPVIVATQMLESMIDNARPTRAEVSDVSHAVARSADAVMLSAETAVGAYALESVQMMDRIARQTEAYQWQTREWGVHSHEPAPSLPVQNIVARSASEMSRDLQARAMIVITQSGISSQTMSSARPAAPILAITSDPDVFNRMSLIWGVVPILDDRAGTENPNAIAREYAVSMELATTGQHLLLVRGVHDDQQMNQPTVTVITV